MILVFIYVKHPIPSDPVSVKSSLFQFMVRTEREDDDDDDDKRIQVQNLHSIFPWLSCVCIFMYVLLEVEENERKTEEEDKRRIRRYEEKGLSLHFCFWCIDPLTTALLSSLTCLPHLFLFFLLTHINFFFLPFLASSISHPLLFNHTFLILGINIQSLLDSHPSFKVKLYVYQRRLYFDAKPLETILWLFFGWLTSNPFQKILVLREEMRVETRKCFLS